MKYECQYVHKEISDSIFYSRKLVLEEWIMYYY